MRETPYSLMPTNDLLELALCRDSFTQLEIELAQRLALALDMLEESNAPDDS